MDALPIGVRTGAEIQLLAWLKQLHKLHTDDKDISGFVKEALNARFMVTLHADSLSVWGDVWRRKEQRETLSKYDGHGFTPLFA